MHRAGKALIVLVVVILFGLGIFCGIKLSHLTGLGSGPKTLSTPALLVRVQTLSDLVTIKYVIEKVEMLEIPSENLVGQVIGSENRVLLLAHGIVKAGISLDKLKVEDLSVDGKHVSIKLPPAQILDAYLDENQTKVIDRTTGLLAPPDKDLEQNTRRNALDSIRRAARKSGILNEAQTQARAQLINLFTQLGFERVEFRGRDSVESPVSRPPPVE